ncbi:hypothetical protein [Streptomyces sp. Wb2n-11]|uniref:hypothetical protein n=1 Tax=Streptomyces sp. Wb2n-11 TaxID=1030533 RepID=UPI000A7EA5D9|nr:hypothetical protein [Streptomyces sp. Wb2n-11]
MTSNPDFTATITERTVVVTWPGNERGGATPPPDDWQDRAWAQESTLYEIDEGPVSGCSVLRWRNDPRSDAELVAVSLSLVSGKPTPAVRLSPDRAALRDRIAETLRECGIYDTEERLWRSLSPAWLEEIGPAVLAVLPPPADQAAVLAEAIRRVEDPAERAKTTTGLGLGWEAARDVLRRMTAEAQQQPETTTADKAAELGITDTQYRACSHRAAVEAVRAAMPGLYASVALRVEDALAVTQQQECTLCGHLTCMGGKPCGVISTERGELHEPCGRQGAEAQ